MANHRQAFILYNFVNEQKSSISWHLKLRLMPEKHCVLAGTTRFQQRIWRDAAGLRLQFFRQRRPRSQGPYQVSCPCLSEHAGDGPLQPCHAGVFGPSSSTCCTGHAMLADQQLFYADERTYHVPYDGSTSGSGTSAGGGFGSFRDAGDLFEEAFGSTFGEFFSNFGGVGSKSSGKRQRTASVSPSPPRAKPVESPLKCSLEELFVSATEPDMRNTSAPLRVQSVIIHKRCSLCFCAFKKITSPCYFGARIRGCR
jgi:hypothetical protein